MNLGMAMLEECEERCSHEAEGNARPTVPLRYLGGSMGSWECKPRRSEVLPRPGGGDTR